MAATIVVGVDGSQRDADALALARLLAGALQLGLTLAHVFPHEDVAGSAAAVEDQGSAIEHAGAVPPATDGRTEPASAAADRVLAEAAGTVGGQCELRAIRAHSAARGLQRLAERDAPALIVVGRGDGGSLGALGGVAERLLHGAPCPIAVAPEGLAPHLTSALQAIGVAYDGTPEARIALRFAIDLARHAQAGLHLRLAVARAEREGAAFRRAIDQWAHHQLEEGRALVDPGVPADVAVLEGSPARALAEASADMDLLVCGSRGYGPLAGVVLGGVSGRLVRLVRCPLIVVPRSPAAA